MGVKKSKKKSVTVPLYLSINKSDSSTIHPVMLDYDTGMEVGNEENYQPIYHFAWIRILSRLLSAQVTNYDNHTWYHDNRLNHFKLQTCFENHRRDCMTINKTNTIRYPCRNWPSAQHRANVERVRPILGNCARAKYKNVTRGWCWVPNHGPSPESKSQLMADLPWPS